MRTTEFYRDPRGQWRWRTMARNNRVTAASSESYRNKQDCLDNWFDDHPGVDRQTLTTEGGALMIRTGDKR